MSSAGAKITKSSSPERLRRRMIVLRFQWATARDTVRACDSLKSGLSSYGTTPSGQRLLSPDIAYATAATPGSERSALGAEVIFRPRPGIASPHPDARPWRGRGPDRAPRAAAAGAEAAEPLARRGLQRLGRALIPAGPPAEV
jgi:hypothetical protein